MNGHTRKDIDDYTFSQCCLWIRKIGKLRRRYNADLAVAVVARGFDEKGWKDYVKDL